MKLVVVDITFQLKICVIHLRTVKLVVVDITFQSKNLNLVRFGNTNINSVAELHEILSFLDCAWLE